MLILKREKLKRLIGMPLAIDTMEKVFSASYKGFTQAPLRQSISVPDNQGNALYMPCLIKEPMDLQALGIKIVTVYEDNPDQGLPTILGTYVLNDPTTGEILSILEASYLTGLRTGAVTGLSLRYLARPGAKSLGIIGSGYQAYFQALASAEEKDLEEIRLYDKEKSKALDLRSRLKEEFSKEVMVADSADELAEKSEIIITVTNSAEPVFSGEKLNPGDSVIAVGAYRPDTREVDSITIERANIWVDSLEASLEESGDLVVPMEEGKLQRNDIIGELGGVIEGDTAARRSENEITFFESVGLAFEDAAIAKLTYDRASEEDKGVEVEL